MDLWLIILLLLLCGVALAIEGYVVVSMVRDAIATRRRLEARKSRPITSERKVELIRLHVANQGKIGWVRDLRDEEVEFLADYFSMIGGVPKATADTAGGSSG